MRLKIAAAVMLAFAAFTASPAVAQDTGIVMYVAAGPDHRVSLGLAEPHGDQLTIVQRMEMAPGCTWTRSADLSVPTSEAVPLRDPNSVGGAERFGVLYATTYSALVAAGGGDPAVENHACIRVTLTEFARSAGVN